MATPKNPDVFFVGINNTADLKRSIIESTRDSLLFLQKYEAFLELRKQKNQTIDELKKLVKEITSMVNNLKKQLPESEIHRRLGQAEISIEKEILGIGVEKKKEEAELANAKAKARRSSAVRKAKAATPEEAKAEQKDNSKAEKEQGEMDKLEGQLKELENRLRKFE
jgi:uncharacterized coiled-coil protein SlyX